VVLGDFGKPVISGACRLIPIIGILIETFRNIWKIGKLLLRKAIFWLRPDGLDAVSLKGSAPKNAAVGLGP